MPAASDLADYLAANLTGGHVVGTDIFAGQMPDAPDTAICVYQTQGRKPDSVEQVEYPGIQIIVRAATDPAAMALAITIMKLLAGAINLTINTRSYHWIESQGSPINLGQDDKLRVTYTLSFIVMKDMES